MTIASLQPESCARMLKHRRKKLRRVVTAQPELFPHSLQDQYTLDDADPDELNHWAVLFLNRIRAIPGVMDVTTDQLNAGPMLDITITRIASAYGILPFTIDNTLDDAFGQRIVSTMFTTLNQ